MRPKCVLAETNGPEEARYRSNGLRRGTLRFLSVKQHNTVSYPLARSSLANVFVTFALKPDGSIEWMKIAAIPSGQFQFRVVCVFYAGFEKVGPGLCNAGNDSKQLEELTTCNPGGSEFPKLRTASARSGGTYVDRSWMVSSAMPSASKREIACLRIVSSMSSERSLVRRAISTMAEPVTSVNVDKSNRAFSPSPAVSAATTECRGPYSGMRAPNRPSDQSQIGSPGSFLIFATSSWPSKARVPASRCSRLATRRHSSYSSCLFTRPFFLLPGRLVCLRYSACCSPALMLPTIRRNSTSIWT